MVINLDRAALTSLVKRPGIVVVNWTDPRESGPTMLFNQALRRTAEANPGVRFGTIDLVRHPDLAREWAVEDVPSLMVFRDGTLLYRRIGAAPEQELRVVLHAAGAVDMAEVRKRVNGYGGRLALEKAEAAWFEAWLRDQDGHDGDGDLDRSSKH
jgi:thioredoxin reductase (NADPH)